MHHTPYVWYIAIRCELSMGEGEGAGLSLIRIVKRDSRIQENNIKTKNDFIVRDNNSFSFPICILLPFAHWFYARFLSLSLSFIEAAASKHIMFEHENANYRNVDKSHCTKSHKQIVHLVLYYECHTMEPSQIANEKYPWHGNKFSNELSPLMY